MKLIFAMALLLSLSTVLASVDFITPKNKEVVPSTFPVEFTVEGMSVAKAGNMKANTGHHHLIVDGKPVPKGKLVPKNETHFHFGDGATKTQLTLTPGLHTLTLQFADGAHKSFGKKFSKTISVEVK